MKGMYIVTRYLPFILLTTDLYLSFTPDENLGKCRTLDSIGSGLAMLLVICSEWFFILRTYVHWDNNGFLLAAMLSTFFCFLVAAFRIAFVTTVLAAPFLFLFVFELGGSSAYISTDTR
ncbi:hypothetical protein EV424DRAFT_1413533 [Suillus variegatus]|nr:hypothetical protein EV424DRAFT_1413533 [Suillus variegatus]